MCGTEPDLMEGSQDMYVQERGGWCVPLVAGCPRAFIVPQPFPSAICSTGHQLQFMCKICCVAISSCLPSLAPVLREDPALPQHLVWPRPWQTPEQGCLGTFAWDMAGSWLGPGSAGLLKQDSQWGWTLRSGMGTLVGDVSPPQTYPVHCSV